jgi:hypothetical protein
MQADAVHVDRSTPPTSHFGQVTEALRAVESFLLASGQQTARRNAWNAVCEDRKRARDRREALSVLDSAVLRFQQPKSR